ncbi:hypothetical protein PBI_MINERVA_54 [Mycobacterium phage Minerva]|uniref:hypothetical protein n=1 Tax=Mycobacterium phage Minerva TaxID=1527513 RepID=UPI0004EF7A03|nr:hypothetical protein VC71_gp054 [Mycobacterium phage Minerva]AIK69263.1 hypothetical protein PBI_MINERVA_54 [Mycobacterium phage Minerva]
MPADIDVKNQIDGEFADGSPRPWAWVKVRARTVLGSLKAKPFARDIAGKPVASTPSALDHIIGASEQTSWRYVASDGNVYDLKDACLIAIELLLDSVPPGKLAEYRNKASQLRPWPAGYAGRPDFE